MSIEIGADPAPETYANETEHRALIARHSRSVGEAVRSVDERVDAVNTDINDLIKIVWAGRIYTAANATSTTVSATGIVSTDVVLLTPNDGNAASHVAGYSGGSFDNGGSVYAGAGTNLIYISHPSFAGTMTFNAVVVRP